MKRLPKIYWGPESPPARVAPPLGKIVTASVFFSFSGDGTTLMHPDRVKEAAQKQVPENSGISGLSSTIDYDDLTWKFFVGPADPWNHPERGSTGSILVHFKIEDGDFAPKSAEFIPDHAR